MIQSLQRLFETYAQRLRLWALTHEVVIRKEQTNEATSIYRVSFRGRDFDSH